ncbi:hypothetical protein [Cupriavidus necator]|uniref:hypothetical protein n=1 Tax=Cupriavidus necator TaxID=106590 RepID=UPI0005B3FCD4|nr:hypothetical protein [Cupriavidus necator]
MPIWLHIQGIDDMVAAPSREEAERVAAAYNRFWTVETARRKAEIAAEGRNPDFYPTCVAVVVEDDDEGHAESLAEEWPDYLVYYDIAPTEGAKSHD